MQLKKLLLSTLALASLDAKASSSLPYIGPQQLTCDIRTPSVIANDIDAGFLASEDCKTIFILPPVEGAIKFGGVSEAWDTKLCPVVDRTLDLVAEYYKKYEIAEPSEAKDILREVVALEAELEKLAGKRVVSVVAASAQLRWDRIIQAYKDINPGVDIRRLPIASGVFTTATYAKDDQDVSHPMGGVSEVSVSGLELPADLEDVSNMSVPDYLRKTSKRNGFVNVLMGEGVGLNLFLTLQGACSFKKESKFAVAGTYTYFYPVQTKSFFRIELNENALEKEIMDMARSKKGEVNVDELNKVVSKSSSVRVVLNPGASSSVEEVKRLETEYKEELTKFAIENILAVVGTEMKSMVEEASYYVQEQRYERVCRRRFLRSKKCHTNVYNVTVKKIDWNHLNIQLEDLLGTNNTGAQVDSYLTFYMSGTSSMLPAPTAVEKTSEPKRSSRSIFGKGR